MIIRAYVRSPIINSLKSSPMIPQRIIVLMVMKKSEIRDQCITRTLYIRIFS